MAGINAKESMTIELKGINSQLDDSGIKATAINNLRVGLEYKVATIVSGIEDEKMKSLAEKLGLEFHTAVDTNLINESTYQQVDSDGREGAEGVTFELSKEMEAILAAFDIIKKADEAISQCRASLETLTSDIESELPEKLAMAISAITTFEASNDMEKLSPLLRKEWKKLIDERNSVQQILARTKDKKKGRERFQKSMAASMAVEEGIDTKVKNVAKLLREQGQISEEELAVIQLDAKEILVYVSIQRERMETQQVAARATDTRPTKLKRKTDADGIASAAPASQGGRKRLMTWLAGAAAVAAIALGVKAISPSQSAQNPAGLAKAAVSKSNADILDEPISEHGMAMYKKIMELCSSDSKGCSQAMAISRIDQFESKYLLKEGLTSQLIDAIKNEFLLPLVDRIGSGEMIHVNNIPKLSKSFDFDNGSKLNFIISISGIIKDASTNMGQGFMINVKWDINGGRDSGEFEVKLDPSDKNRQALDQMVEQIADVAVLAYVIQGY